MTPVILKSKISDIQFADDFTGNGKIFVEVSVEQGKEKMVVYEKSGLSAFFTDVFRDRSKTFTLREWAHRKLGDLPETFDKERLTQNIKQIKPLADTKNCTPAACALVNKLVENRKLDADPAWVQSFLRNDLPQLTLHDFSHELSSAIRDFRGQLLPGIGQEAFMKQFNEKTAAPHFGQLAWPVFSPSGQNGLDRLTTCLLWISEKDWTGGPLAVQTSALKNFAKVMLMLAERKPEKDLMQQRYINTLKLCIRKLEIMEFEQTRQGSARQM